MVGNEYITICNYIDTTISDLRSILGALNNIIKYKETKGIIKSEEAELHELINTMGVDKALKLLKTKNIRRQ